MPPSVPERYFLVVYDYMLAILLANFASRLLILLTSKQPNPALHLPRAEWPRHMAKDSGHTRWWAPSKNFLEVLELFLGGPRGRS